MTNPVWPGYLCPAAMEWRLQRYGVQSRSPFNGSFQSVDFMGDHWEVNIAINGAGRQRTHSAELEALLMHLTGGVNYVDVYHWIRPVPRGTMRGSPTVGTSAARGDTSMVLTVATGSTLLAGDLFGVGTQIFMARSDCAASGTALTVPLVNRPRGTIASSTAVVWNRPKLAVVAPEMSAGLTYRPGMTLPAEVRLIEP